MAAQGRNEFRLPDVGEGLTEAEIVTWRVAAGDTVKVNDILVEIETAKSLVELPCPWSGVVDDLMVSEGETVAVGTPIIAVRVGAAAGSADPAAEVAAGESDVAADLEATEGTPAAPAAAPASEQGDPESRTAVLVGYGPRQGSPKRRQRKSDPAKVPAPRPSAESASPQPIAAETSRVLAKPPVRRLAKDLGVDLQSVQPTGPGSTVTRADLEAHVGQAEPNGHVAPASPAADRPPVAGKPATAGEPERIPVRGVRKATADAMVASAFTAPHAATWLSVDVTRSMRFVERLRQREQHAGVRFLHLVARACALALRANPEMNATWSESDGQATILRYPHVHLGIAVAGDRGLVVPVVRGADTGSFAALVASVDNAVSTARAGRTQPAEMSGGTFTINNFGALGMEGGTPILVPGQAGILGLGAVRQQPWVHKGRIRSRSVVQLTVSFDHRIVDGAEASAFLRDLGSVLADPATALTL